MIHDIRSLVWQYIYICLHRYRKRQNHVMEAVLPVRVVWLFERDKMYLW